MQKLCAATNPLNICKFCVLNTVQHASHVVPLSHSLFTTSHSIQVSKLAFDFVCGFALVSSYVTFRFQFEYTAKHKLLNRVLCAVYHSKAN